MTQEITVAINGFGRIGRAVLRQLLSPAGAGIRVVAINDIAPAETCAYLFEYDSVYGILGCDVDVLSEALIVDGLTIPLTHSRDLTQVDLSGVDLVLECTGKASGADFASAGLRAGAGKVLISGPSDAAEITIVRGANEANLGAQRIVSNASCTTNALAPLMKVLDDKFGLVAGHMTTIHCYTGSQPTVDAPRGTALERNRAAALSMVPTTTSAARLIDRVLPHLAGRVKGCAVRVPTASVSAVDLTVQLGREATVEEINEVFATGTPGLIGVTKKLLVSQDLKARSESIVMALPQTTVIGGGLVRVFGWYDNEWGFSARMLDVARLMAAV